MNEVLMDYMKFPTRKEATDHIATMQGYQSIKPVKLLVYPDAKGKDRYAWMVMVNGYRYLRTDGFVR